MTQPDLFPAKPVIKCPICAYDKHCGSLAECDEPADKGGCINTDVRCLRCGATGVISQRTDL